MATFEDHIAQAKKNLAFVESVNNQIPESWDWQVTASFYVAVHLVNAHIAKSSGSHYKTHSEVKKILNPFNKASACRLDESHYLSYEKLMNLSRRSRYICHESVAKGNDTRKYATFDKHFMKALRHLDKLVLYFSTKYHISFPTLSISCVEMNRSEKFRFFEKSQ